MEGSERPKSARKGAPCTGDHSQVHGRSPWLSIKRPEMTQPPRTKSLGCTIERTAEIGIWTSFPVPSSVPMDTVEAWRTEPI